MVYFRHDNIEMVSLAGEAVHHWHYLPVPVVHLYISRHGLARPVWHPVNTALQTLCENPFLDLIGPCWLCSATIGQAPSRETVPLARGRHFGKLCFAQMTVLVLTQVVILQSSAVFAVQKLGNYMTG